MQNAMQLPLCKSGATNEASVLMHPSECGVYASLSMCGGAVTDCCTYMHYTMQSISHQVAHKIGESSEKTTTTVSGNTTIPIKARVSQNNGRSHSRIELVRELRLVAY